MPARNNATGSIVQERIWLVAIYESCANYARSARCRSLKTRRALYFSPRFTPQRPKNLIGLKRSPGLVKDITVRHCLFAETHGTFLQPPLISTTVLCRGLARGSIIIVFLDWIRMAGLEVPEISHSKSRSIDSALQDSNRETRPHKPLHLTKSDPSLRSRLRHQDPFDGRRSRSQSVPLTAEAVQVAKQLKRASDLFYDQYVSSKVTTSVTSYRRRSVASSSQGTISSEVEFFSYRNEITTVTNAGPPGDGTPVWTGKDFLCDRG